MPKLKDKLKKMRACSISDTKVENGMIMGYASTWNNLDTQGDVVRKGAFAKTIKERVAAGKVPLMVIHMLHGGDTIETIGVISKAVEDDTGLWVEAELFDSQFAQETRDKIKIAPNLFGQSIGYKAITSKVLLDEAGNETGFEELLEIMLMEVTVTARPANTETSAGAKTEGDISELEDLRAELSALRKTVDAIQGVPSDTVIEVKTAATHTTLDENDHSVDSMREELERQRRVIVCMETKNEGFTSEVKST